MALRTLVRLAAAGGASSMAAVATATAAAASTEEGAVAFVPLARTGLGARPPAWAVEEAQQTVEAAWPLARAEAPGTAQPSSTGTARVACAALATLGVLLLRANGGRRRQPRGSARSMGRPSAATPLRATGEEYGVDLALPSDSFCVLGLAHCFEQVDGKLQDAWVLEPVTGSTVEVIQNGCKTSYETYIGTTVGEILKQDAGIFSKDLLNGHEQVQFGNDLEFRTGCAARTWMRDHARDVVRLLAPLGEVKTDFNTDVSNKRILNFVNEVDDSDNIKQDMSIDVYGREEEEEEDADPAAASVDDLYNA